MHWKSLSRHLDVSRTIERMWPSLISQLKPRLISHSGLDGWSKRNTILNWEHTSDDKPRITWADFVSSTNVGYLSVPDRPRWWPWRFEKTFSLEAPWRRGTYIERLLPHRFQYVETTGDHFHSLENNHKPTIGGRDSEWVLAYRGG